MKRIIKLLKRKEKSNSYRKMPRKRKKSDPFRKLLKKLRQTHVHKRWLIEILKELEGKTMVKAGRNSTYSHGRSVLLAKRNIDYLLLRLLMDVEKKAYLYKI